MSEPSADVLEELARRSELLRALRAGPQPKRDLVESLSLSRSTVDRAVRDLESRGFVERDDGVTLTLHGRLVLDAYDEFTDTLSAVDDAQVVLDPLPADATIDPVLLRGASVVGPDPVSPQRPFVAYQEHLRDAVGVRGFAPAVLEDNVPLFRERIVADGLDVDLTVSPDALDELLSAYADSIDEALASGHLTLRRATETLEYALMLVDQPEHTVVCALFYDERGLVGSLHNDAPDAVRWAEQVYERVRNAAEPLQD
ncbi:MAG: helix-turn-helix transcriptional regulator [Halobacterium sp.]